MADIQATQPASFMQVANTQKTSAKDPAGAGLQLASFHGVLKSKIIHQDAALELTVKGDAAAALTGKVSADATLLPSELAAPQAEAELPVEVMVNLSNSPAADATVQTSALAAALGSNIVVEKQPQSVAAEREATTAEVDATLSEAATDASYAKPLVPGKSEALIKPNGAAIAAAQGHALPRAEGAAGAQAVVATPAEAKQESLIAVPAAVSLVRGDIVTSSLTPITVSPTAVTHPFEQALRQAESKIHAAIETPVRSPAFAAELSDKVVWLSTRQGQLAELSLNPPQMGSLEVRLKVFAGETSAQFFSPNPVVREMLDAALPKLRDLMAQAGINLGEAEVREHAFGRREPSEARQNGAANEVEGLALPAAMAGNSGHRTSGSGLVDLYI